MKKIYILFSLIGLCAIFMTITNFFNSQANNKTLAIPPEQNHYLLIEENDAVNLYYGDVLVKTYKDIIVDALPITDRDNIKSGIILKNYDDVLSIIEDFDG